MRCPARGSHTSAAGRGRARKAGRDSADHRRRPRGGPEDDRVQAIRLRRPTLGAALPDLPSWARSTCSRGPAAGARSESTRAHRFRSREFELWEGSLPGGPPVGPPMLARFDTATASSAVLEVPAFSRRSPSSLLPLWLGRFVSLGLGGMCAVVVAMLIYGDVLPGVPPRPDEAAGAERAGFGPVL